MIKAIYSLFAAPSTIDPNTIGLKDPVKDPNALVGSILNTVYAWAGILCVIIIIIAGYYYVTSSGDSAGVKRAKQAIVGASVGIIIIIMAFAVTQFVIGKF